MFKRLLLPLSSAIAVIGLVAGGTFALFTASASSPNNSFAAGTVSLDTPAFIGIPVSNLAPGDSGVAGTWDITYTGSLQAFLGIDVALSEIGSPGLVTCDGGKFHVILTGGNFNAHPIYLDVNPHIAGAVKELYGVMNPGDVAHIQVAYSLDASAGNACQGKQAGITIWAHAVQVKNNDGGGFPLIWGY